MEQCLWFGVAFIHRTWNIHSQSHSVVTSAALSQVCVPPQVSVRRPVLAFGCPTAFTASIESVVNKTGVNKRCPKAPQQESAAICSQGQSAAERLHQMGQRNLDGSGGRRQRTDDQKTCAHARVKPWGVSVSVVLKKHTIIRWCTITNWLKHCQVWWWQAFGFFCFNFSFCSKLWSHSVMAVRE